MPERWSSWGQAIIGALVGAALSVPITLVVSSTLEQRRDRRMAVTVACDLLKEIKVNSEILQQKRAIVNSVYSQYKIGKDQTSMLKDIKYQHFQTNVHEAQAGNVHTLSVEIRDKIYGMYGVLMHSNLKEPELIESIQSVPEERSWNLGALATFYVVADDLLTDTEDSLKTLCK